MINFQRIFPLNLCLKIISGVHIIHGRNKTYEMLPRTINFLQFESHNGCKSVNIMRIEAKHRCLSKAPMTSDDFCHCGALLAAILVALSIIALPLFSLVNYLYIFYTQTPKHQS